MSSVGGHGDSTPTQIPNAPGRLPCPYSTRPYDLPDLLEEMLASVKAKQAADQAMRVRVWHEVEQKFGANDPISNEMREALSRTRVRFRGGGLHAAFESVSQTQHSPRSRSEEDGVSVLFDERAVEMEEERADDLSDFAFIEQVLSLEDEQSAKAEGAYDLWWQLLELLQRHPELTTFLIVPDAIKESWMREYGVWP